MTTTSENSLTASLENGSSPDVGDLTASTAANELCTLLYQRPDLWGEVRLSAADMPNTETAQVFTALQRLHQRGAEPTKSLLVNEIAAVAGRKGAVSDWRLNVVVHGKPKPANLAEYQRIIRRAADLNRLRVVQRELDECIANEDPSAAWAALNRALASPPEQEPRRTVKDVLWRVIQSMESPVPPVPLGFTPLDAKMAGGLRPGQVMVLAARPGVGKSALALQFILNVAGRGDPVALWSLEMSPEQWIRRALSFEALVDSKRILTGELNDDEYSRVAWASGRINDAKLIFADITDTTPDGWRLEATRCVREYGSRLLVVDYLQLMQSPRGAWSRENEVATMSRTVKQTALSLGVPVLMLAQLNREAQDKTPTLRNLRESGAVEQDADMVCFIHRDLNAETGTYNDEGLLILAKQRDGETGAIPVRYERSHYRFIAMTDDEPPADMVRSNNRRWPYDD